MGKTKTTSELSVWENPPSFKCPLYVTLLGVLACSSLLLTIGVTLSASLGPLMGDLLDGPGARRTKLCRSHELDLCPTLSDFKGSQMNELGPWYSGFTTFIVLTGLADLLLCLVATFAARCNAKHWLFGTLFAFPFTIAMKWYIVGLAVFPETPVFESVQDTLVEKYKQQYPMSLVEQRPSSYTLLLNTIFISAGCCGIRTPEDARFPTQLTINGSFQFNYPPACCSQSHGENEMVMTTMGNLCVYADGKYTLINSKGCFQAVYNYVNGHFGSSYLLLLGSLIMLQSFQFLFSALELLRRSQEVQTQQQARSHDGSPARPSLTSSRRNSTKGDHYIDEAKDGLRTIVRGNVLGSGNFRAMSMMVIRESVDVGSVID